MNNMSIKSTKNKEDFKYIVIIYTLSLATRAVKLLIDPLLLRDSVYYLSLAKQWSISDNYSILTYKETNVPPLHIYLIKELINRGYDAEVAGRIYSLFCGALIPVLVYYLSLKIFNSKISAILASFICIFHHKLVELSIQPLRENLYIVLFLIIIILIYPTKQGFSILYYFISGVIGCLMLFTRYEAVESLFIVSFFPLLNLLYLKKNKYMYITLLLSSFLGCFVCFIFLPSLIDCNLSFLYKFKNFFRDFF